jgi:hypothetical protein
MSWSDQLFRYCERGQDASFWAEPLNAISNGAFMIVAAAGAAALWRRQVTARRDDPDRWALWALVALVAIIGAGSFAFHTFATRWAALADVAPIGAFMLGYLAYALRRYVDLAWWAVVFGLVVFVAALQIAGSIECRPGLLAVTAAARGPCLNGTLGYAPALLAMLAIGSWLVLASDRATGAMLLTAGAVFAVSMVLRTVDFEVCAATRLLGKARGTHALWHLCNALTLYLLLRAAIERSGRAEGDCQARGGTP